MLYTKHVELTTTAETTLFTVPDGYHAIIHYIFIANHGGSANDASLWYINGSDRVDIFDGTSITGGAKETLGNGGGPLFVLHEGEAVKAQTGSAGDVEFAVTFDLVGVPVALVNFT